MTSPRGKQRRREDVVGVIAALDLDEAAAAGLRLATERYRAGMDVAANKIADLGGLKPGLGTADAADILWFYFGYSGFFTLMDDNGWSADRSEQWLREMAATAVLSR